MQTTAAAFKEREGIGKLLMRQFSVSYCSFFSSDYLSSIIIMLFDNQYRRKYIISSTSSFLLFSRLFFLSKDYIYNPFSVFLIPNFINCRDGSQVDINGDLSSMLTSLTSDTSISFSITFSVLWVFLYFYDFRKSVICCWALLRKEWRVKCFLGFGSLRCGCFSNKSSS